MKAKNVKSLPIPGDSSNAPTGIKIPKRLGKRSKLTKEKALPTPVDVEALLGSLKRKALELNRDCVSKKKEGTYPMSVLSLKRRVNTFVRELQHLIALMSRQDTDNFDKSLKVVEYFAFSLVIRVYAVESMRTRSSRSTPGTDDFIIDGAKDVKACMDLIGRTDYKHTDFSPNMEVRYVEIPKNGTDKVRVLGVGNLVDRVLQEQFRTLLDPIVESRLPEFFYGFRPGRSALQAIAVLHTSIVQSDTNDYHLVSADIKKCFDSFSHDYVMKHFPFPEKYRPLLLRWLQCVRVYKDGRREKLTSGVPQGSIVAPSICNYILAGLLKDFFQEYPSGFKKTNLKGNRRLVDAKSRRFIIGYADDIMVRVFSHQEAVNALSLLETALAPATLELNRDKCHIYDLSKRARFDWLGYTFLNVPKETLRFTRLVSTGQRLTRSKSKSNPSVVLLYVSDRNFRKTKDRLNEVIGSLRHRHLLPVLQEVNSIVRGFSYYFNFATSGHRMNFLHHFVDRCFWRRLVDKFRYRGIRRTRWVARTFFLAPRNVGAPFGRTWLLHSPIPSSNSWRTRGRKTLWLEIVGQVVRRMPIKVVALPKELRQSSFYLCREEFEKWSVEVQTKRANYKKSSLNTKLFKDQDGLCAVCREVIDLTSEENYEIHHIYPRSGDMVHPDRKHRGNLRLMHRDCHKDSHGDKKGAGLYNLLFPYPTPALDNPDAVEGLDRPVAVDVVSAY